MKKSLVAVSVIVALGAVWTGGAWYTGKQLENHMVDMVNNANSALKNALPDSGISVSYQDYHRGWFTSRMKLVLKAEQNAKNALLKPDQQIFFNERIDHGPFPLAQLKKFNILPSMASVYSTLEQNPTTQPLFDMSKGISFIDAHTRISYSGSTSSAIKLQPLTYDRPEQKIAFSGAQLTADADGKGNALSIKGDAQSGLINTVNKYGQHVQITFNNLQTNGKTSLSDFKERIGSQKMTIDKLALTIEGKDLATLGDVSVNLKTDVQEDKKHLNGQIDYAFKSLMLQNQDIGQGNLTLKASNIDGSAMHEFSQRYNTASQKLLTDPQLLKDPAQYQHRMIEILVENLPLLLKGNPIITVAPLSWKNDKGESTFNLSLLLKDFSQTPGQAVTPEQALDRLVQSFDGKLVIPMDMAVEFMTRIAQLQGYKEDEAKKLATQQVKGIAALGQMFHVTTVENDSIISSLQYARGKATLNGQSMSLSDLVGMFGPLGGNITPPTPEMEMP